MSALSRSRVPVALIATLLLVIFSLLSRPAGAEDDRLVVLQDLDEGNTGIVIPSDQPSGEDGLLVHRQRCANCHGEQGLGDGELAAGLPNPPAPHASTEYLREAIPAEMFATITAGRVERGMPPFGPSSSNPLSDEERWNAIAAIYSLGTPLESVNHGFELYINDCAGCHGEEGRGDGPDAVDIDPDPGNLSSLEYWFGTSNRQVFEAYENALEIHPINYDEDDLWSIIDYMRTFSYEYTDALAAFRPLESGTISGQITNGTTGDSVPMDTVATLRGFTQDLNITLTLTDTLDEAGRYRFELSDIPQDWFYRTSIEYKDLDFGSDFGQLSIDEPVLDLPVTVFESTSDPEIVNIEQVHLILGFGEDRVDVSELYVASNTGSAVFVGETGIMDDGTFRISLPDGAQNIAFQRGFGSVDSFIAANEIISAESGWADTLPLRPGIGTLNLLVQYSLPYDDGVAFSHLLHYPTSLVNLVIPDVGVSLENSESWQDTGQRVMGSSTVSTYGLSDVPTDGTLDISLEGQPRTAAAVAPGESNVAVEIIAGAAAALVLVGVAAVIIRQWQTRPSSAVDRHQLLEEIAALDDAYEAGEIAEAKYEQEREALKAELMEIWEEEN